MNVSSSSGASGTGWLKIAAFAAIYIIWGSTYLAIAFVIETLPPFLMAGGRFLLAGALMFGWARLRGAQAPSLLHWKNTAIIGGMLILLGNGAVVWAEQRVASGVAALLVTTEPLWVVVLQWLGKTRQAPSRGVILGLLIGAVGMLVLVSPWELEGTVDLLGSIIVFLAAGAWAWGSLFSSRASLPSSAVLTTGMQMLCGGAMLLCVGTVSGEWQTTNWAAISQRSWLALGYLVVFGSLIAFTAYSWLTRVAPPSQVSTYAYVNPVIAVFLGWAFAQEVVTGQTIMATVLLVAAVVLITLKAKK
ncbi:EamA family transporter [Rufibacter sediminis]|uniref:EamA family transporter n=1 Tax=Rufibacter sediminis TaxID=2762756 RepID=A0ABR6VVA2_9BACT|nr:EamA family transporter [Rufibacter sediminis]MBC3541114.1 EamA family transporter [Rufibacter sediminis]